MIYNDIEAIETLYDGMETVKRIDKVRTERVAGGGRYDLSPWEHRDLNDAVMNVKESLRFLLTDDSDPV